MKKIGFVLAVVSAIIIISACKEKEHSFGRYVFQDDKGILHLDENCPRLHKGVDANGHEIYAKMPIDTSEILTVGRVCTECFPIANYEHLKEIASKNKKIDDYARWLHKELDDKYSDIPEYDEFMDKIEDQGKRQMIYQASLAEGIEEDISYEEFSAKLGFPIKGSAKSKFSIHKN